MYILLFYFIFFYLYVLCIFYSFLIVLILITQLVIRECDKKHLSEIAANQEN